MVMQDDPTNLDALIDDVARDMTSRRADDGLAHRVSVRVQDADAARTRVWPRGWLLAPAAAAVVLLAVIVVRQFASSEVRPTASAPIVRLTPSARATGVEKPDAATVVASTTVRQTTSAKATAVRMPDITRQTDPDFQPLTTAPIELESLDVSPLVVVMPIEISTIAIERIEIAAMP